MGDRETPIMSHVVEAIKERALAHLHASPRAAGDGDAPEAECCVFARYALRLARGWEVRADTPREGPHE